MKKFSPAEAGFLELDAMLVAAKAAATAGRRVLLEYFGKIKQIESKFQAGLVSEADKETEKEIERVLKEHAPQSDFLGEEMAFSSQNEKQLVGLHSQSKMDERGLWIVDPLDGTTNYVHRFPIFCISIGLRLRGEMVLGLVDVPLLNKTYWAIKGRGAFVNGEVIRVSQTDTLKQSLLTTGFFAEIEENLEKQLKTFSKIVRKVRGVRRPGAAAYDLCLVAEGVFDGFWERHLKPWDTAAGFVLVKEAGGQVTTLEGEEYDPFCTSILASNSKLHAVLVEELS